MKIIKKDISAQVRDGDQIQIVPIADLHIGDPRSDLKVIKGLISYTLSEKKAYTILNGDLMDVAIAASIGSTYDAVAQPAEQLRVCEELFGPLARQGKILAIVGGNHEERIRKQVGIDMTHLLAKQLNCEDVYADTGALLFLSTGTSSHGKGKTTYSIYIGHGHGGGRRPGGKINALEDYGKIVDADIYVVGHTHLPAAFRQSFYRPRSQNKSVSLVDRLYVNTASALSYGGYGETHGYAPASNDYPVIYLRTNKREIGAKI